MTLFGIGRKYLVSILDSYLESLISWLTEVFPRLVAIEMGRLMVAAKENHLDEQIEDGLKAAENLKVAVLTRSPYLEMAAPLLLAFVKDHAQSYPNLTRLYDRYGSIKQLYKSIGDDGGLDIEQAIAEAIAQRLENLAGRLLAKDRDDA